MNASEKQNKVNIALTSLKEWQERESVFRHWDYTATEVMAVRIREEDPEWSAIKALLQAFLTRNIAAAEKAFAEACALTVRAAESGAAA